MKEQSGRLEGIKAKNSILNVSGKEATTMTYVNIKNGTPVYIKSGREIKNFLEVLSEMKTEKISVLISDKERTHKSRWVPPETHCVLSAYHDDKI